MSAAKQGDTVRVHYNGTLKNGTQFDSSREAEPLEFKIGEGRIIPGFESAVVGMAPGDSKKVEIPSNEAYGPRREELTQEVDRSRLPSDLEVQQGMQLQATGPNEQPLVVTVAEVKPESVVLDANHPLAGEDLTFDIELVEVV
ncbi:FKBP-type peptidyl-prolyl cis-trans isomerase [Aquibaculum arenosum]|uniref:Peptidyl-prolyl cis-trans isomerase n=1 Tax=Aquibaculum arenosum TaxID=3032591 RepID=A0ABT5YJG5_9PROT|nr:peptidylprolyl isomerase [Fodinicurvata sp. CAU 1616]MDF2094404.1 peptidylprolyl isomerase [Fodinicurvata sp. CAU 1616]